MNRKSAFWLSVTEAAVVAALVVCLSWNAGPDVAETAETPAGESAGATVEAARKSAKRKAKASAVATKTANAPKVVFEDEADDAPAPTPEEVSEAEEERLVDAFDALTDKWMEPSSNGVSMADVKRFSDQFRKVPMSRRDECLHRALNLVPDENVMLLAGILMDKSYGAEILDTVYGDVLNRSEEVKKPILQQIFKDKTHPCWADTAWILDVTDELPKHGNAASATAKEGGEDNGGENEKAD